MNQRSTVLNRRQFVSAVSLSAAATSASAILPRRVHAGARHDVVRLGFIGLGGRGQQLLGGFLERDDIKVVGLCEVNRQRLRQAADLIRNATGGDVLETTDLKELLAMREIDAVIIATPDHWHAPAAIHARQAGKHVYVEKPISNSVWEGRQAVQAARQNHRVVQSGMQNRSAPYNIQAREYIQSAELGEIVLCRVYNQKYLPNFVMASNGTPPAELDWDRWLGPRPEVNYNATRHQHWHQFWDYGGGEVTNDGVHQLDLACMVLGIEQLPKSVHSIGHRREEIAAETPDTVVSTFEFETFPMTFHQTLQTEYMLKTDPETRNGDLFPYWQQNATRIEIFGTKGVMFLGRHGGGWQVFDRPHQRQPVVKAQQFGRFPDPEHKADFLDAIRSDRFPSADIAHGHRSATLCHLANISYRAGNKHLAIDPQTEQIINCPEGAALLRAEYRSPYTIPSLG